MRPVDVAPLDYREQILTLARVMAEHIGRSEQTISMRVYGNRRLFDRLRSGCSLTVDTYHTVKGWFAENWPPDLPWPAGVLRPGKSASPGTAARRAPRRAGVD